MKVRDEGYSPSPGTEIVRDEGYSPSPDSIIDRDEGYSPSPESVSISVIRTYSFSQFFLEPESSISRLCTLRRSFPFTCITGIQKFMRHHKF
jgi:hypothetical protein